MGKFCQSCGMPMDKDPGAGGTEKGNVKSTDYCSYCYLDGKFTQSDFTAQQMQEFCIVKMKEQGWPGWLAWLFTRNIPKLKRWKK